MKVIFSLFFIFLYCKQSVANDLWTIDKNISSIEFEVPVLLTKNVIGKFNEFDGFVSLDLSNQNNNKALINVRIDSLDINYKRYKDLVLSEVFFDSKASENKAFAYLKEASFVNEVISLNITLQI